jgi:hypothetical protein
MVIPRFDTVASTVASTTPNGLAVTQFGPIITPLVTKPQSLRHQADDPWLAEWGKSSKDGRRYVVLCLAICR